MKLRDMARGEAWMTDAEAALNKKLILALRHLLAKHGTGESPLLALRVADVSIHLLLVKRQEASLTLTGENSARELSGTLAEQISKSRERLRKAIRELEDACARMGKPIDVGLAEQLLPMVNKTRDLLHDGKEKEPSPIRDSQ